MRSEKSKKLTNINYGFYIAFALCAMYLLVRTFGIGTQTFTEEEGREIYSRLLGKPASCVKILAAKAAYVPILDQDESIHFRTCPEDVRRILKDKTYRTDTVPRSNFNSWIPGDKEFYSPGATILSLTWDKEGNGGYQCYLSLDSTEMYYCDWW